MLSNDGALDLWRSAREYIAGFWRTHGSPSDVARFGFIGPAFRRELLAWLQPIEALLRRLIARDAAFLAPSLRLRALRKQQRTRVRRVIELNAASAQTWPAPFRCDERIAPRRPSGFRRLQAPSPRHAFALALRFEACVRVFNDPAPFARRLAFRLLRARAALASLAKLPERYVDQTRWCLGRDAIAEASLLLRAAYDEFLPDSS